MPRRRLGVALLVPTPMSHEIDGLRRALGDSALDRMAPHITLVPPVNVREDDLWGALELIRHGASEQRGRLELDVGPVTTFHPASPVAYLAVDDSGGQVEALMRRVFRGVLDRTVDHDFVPHITVSEGMNGLRLESAVGVLRSYRRTISFDRVHLLEKSEDDDGVQRWHPIADAVFGRRTMGGGDVMALELTESQTVDPEAWEVWGRPVPRDSMVITARRLGDVVGVAVANAMTGEIVDLVIPEDARGQGISRQLRLHLDDALAAASLSD